LSFHTALEPKERERIAAELDRLKGVLDIG
jgi:hypothetical protein